ncbi:hypothetical protein CDD82_3008 [Ophiocordyceps australis]|uniref:DSBA-like thioredoxin domain-containing protein n=1 Tax=Ophiocordyceps australis TaxID=1399860 RepID=A0A2C5ZH63_9HYPO|nr:hypothetical protein CDD82_3008 [Ophiocordyceps australis]
MTVSAKPFVIPIEFFSDSLCPWCWVEKHSLEAAMLNFRKKYPDVDFELIWRSYCLNPLLKTQCDKLSLYDEWAGGKSDQQLSRVRTAAAKYSLPLAISGSSGPSRASQILLASVLRHAGPEAQARVAEALFRGHFAEGRNVSDVEWLVSLACQLVGLSENLVRADLDNPSLGRAVDEEFEEAVEERGVEAVPCVIVLGKYKAGGYQQEDFFFTLFERIRAEYLLPAKSKP